MKEAAKKATSEALHVLAVTALLVIASVLFYRAEKPSQSKAQVAQQTEQTAR